MPDTVISTFYRFTPVADAETFRRCALAEMRMRNVRGSILLAREGINGSIAGAREAVDAFLHWLRAQPGMAHLECKESRADFVPFKRAKVKWKKEIVALGAGGIDARGGEYVAPQDWNARIAAHDTLLLDVRNQYEIDIGGFAGAVNPRTENFREFPEFAERELRAHADKTIAMYCTGGIRCEKAAAYLKSRGFARVLQLHGGILNYLARAADTSKWRGECFVFDERVSVDRNLKRGAYAQCHACRRPLSVDAQRSPLYRRGQSCPHCHAQTGANSRARFAEREKQMQLAASRGRAHLGPQAMPNAQAKTSCAAR